MNATGAAPHWLRPAVDYGPLAVFFDVTVPMLLLALPPIVAAIGNTPTVRLVHLVEPDMAEVWVKLEAANPTGSYKDRMALAMVSAEMRWRVAKDSR